MAFKIVENFQSQSKQLLLIINGTAGAGKSFTINALSRFLKTKVKRCAPTAKAAFLIKRLTIHSFFIRDETNKKKGDLYTSS